MSQDKTTKTTEETTQTTTEITVEETPSADDSRPKTPLERIREGQAKMRHNAGQPGGGKSGGAGGGTSGGHQRRQFNRKAG